MGRLAGAAELLDGPLDDRPELVANLRDLRRLNRLFGAAELGRRGIEVLAPDAVEISVLDVGTGAADIPVAWLARARRDRRTMSVTAVDSRPEVIEAAHAIDPAVDQTPGLTLTVADGLRLPYADEAFDVAHSSQVMHHLDPRDAVAFLRELRRVGRRGVVINDLARGRLNWIVAVLVTRTIARARLTRHDGPLSVRRAYTAAEMSDLVREAGMAPIATIHGFAHHRYAIAAR